MVPERVTVLDSPAGDAGADDLFLIFLPRDVLETGGVVMPYPHDRPARGGRNSWRSHS